MTPLSGLSVSTVDTSFVPPVSDGQSGAFSATLDRVLPGKDEIQAEIAHVLDKKLTPYLAGWAERYGQVGKRNPYLWRWCRQGVEVTSLSCLEPDWYDFACDTKVLGVMLDVLLDDVADQKGDPQLLEELVNLPFREPNFDSIAPADRGYAAFTLEVWNEIQARTRQMPLARQYEKLLRYDYHQLFNTMRYSHLVNEDLSLLNLAEHDLYLPHNMHIMISATVDLSCSPTFNRQELGRLRALVWNAQCMGRIGNLITTWERELKEGDYTSGVYARALAHGDITLDQLEAHDREAIAEGIRSGRHEDYFLRRWAELRQTFFEAEPHLRSVDVSQLLRGYERLIRLHLGSRGYK